MHLLCLAFDLPSDVLGLPGGAAPHDGTMAGGGNETERREFLSWGVGAISTLAGSAARFGNYPALTSATELTALGSLLRTPLVVRPGHIGADELSGLEESVRFLARAEARVGGARWRGAVVSLLRAVTDAIEDGNRSESESGSKLYDVAADLAQLAGWTSYDSGQFTAANQHYLLGLQLCERADNAVLAAKILGDMAQLANVLGHHRDELQYLTRAMPFS